MSGGAAEQIARDAPISVGNTPGANDARLCAEVTASVALSVSCLSAGQNPGVSGGHAGGPDAPHHHRLRAQRPGGQGAAGRPRQHHR